MKNNLTGFIRPINGMLNDVRQENLVEGHGDIKAFKAPKTVIISQDIKDELQVKYLPPGISLTAKRFNIGAAYVGLVGYTANYDNFHNKMIPYLKKWYANQGRDFDAEYKKYVDQLDMYFEIIG